MLRKKIRIEERGDKRQQTTEPESAESLPDAGEEEINQGRARRGVDRCRDQAMKVWGATLRTGKNSTTQPFIGKKVNSIGAATKESGAERGDECSPFQRRKRKKRCRTETAEKREKKASKPGEGSRGV